MTKITRLIMKGFKSFAKHTELSFGDDFNCVLGPNGSGKSNILDALVFVLGRRNAKTMRAEKSSNLIYNGGKTKKPAKEAMVTIGFDNSQHEFPVEEKEVLLSRVVKQNGTSKYLINDKTVTRTDFVSFLQHARIDPDGYNVILQGDVIRFVEMPSTERRQIIEEIAGIGQYEEKKTKALSELERVDGRLGEAEIVLTERSTRLEELKADKDQAQKFKEYTETARRAKATFLHVKYETRQEDLVKIENTITSQKEKLETLKTDIASIETEVDDKKKRIASINKEIEEKGEKDQVHLNRQIEELRVTIATKETRLEGYAQEVERLTKRRSDLEQDNQSSQERMRSLETERTDVVSHLEELQKTLARLETELAGFKEKNKLDQDTGGLEQEIAALEKEIEGKDQEAQSLRQKQQDALRRKDQIEFKMQHLDEQMERVLNLEKENKSQLEQLKKFKKDFDRIKVELNAALDKDSALVKELSAARRVYQEESERLAKLQAQHTQAQAVISGDKALSAVLAQCSKINGIHGTVSSLGNVKSQYAKALEFAAAGRIKSVVVDSDDVASECIEYLKRTKLGTATFLPLNKLKKVSISDAARQIAHKEGAHGLAVELVDFDRRYEAAFLHTFGDTVVVDNVGAAKRLGIGKVRMVTLDGDLVESSGAMRGGYQKSRSGLGFNQKEVAQKLAACEEEVQIQSQKMSRIESQRSELEETITQLRQHKAECEGEIIKLEKQLHVEGSNLDGFKESKEKLRADAKAAEEDADAIIEQVSALNRQIAKSKMQLQQSRMKLNEARSPTIIAQLRAFEEKRSELKQKIVRLETEKKHLDEQTEKILGPELKKVLDIIASTKKDQQQFEDLIEKTQYEVSTMKEDLAEKEKHAQAFQKQFRDLFSQKETINQEISKLHRQKDEKAMATRAIEQRIHTVVIDQTRIKSEIAGLEQEKQEYDGVELLEDETDLNKLQAKISYAEKKKEEMGAVNMRALEVYESVENEYLQLLEKKSILTQEKEDVMLLIEEIEESKKNIFMKTFVVVNDIFKEFFLRLSTKGEAYLELENPDSPFDAGVEVKVRLSSNKFMDIKSLSGGEKTMTALAFIFAIQEHEPASFYVLDEVDAALDKHNSEKLAQLVRSYCDRAQYVVISHNDGVISEASYLYGISMDEHGMSKVTTLSL